MPDKVKIRLDKGKTIIEEGKDTLIGKLLAGCKGKIKINTPFGKQEVKT